MSSEIERELERGTQIRGFRFGLHDFQAQVEGVEAVKRNNDRVEAAYHDESLVTRKMRALVLIIACVAQKDDISHILVHMHAAKKAGATPEEILALLNIVGNWIGNVAKMAGLEAWRATFRPDIPTIFRVVELR